MNCREMTVEAILLGTAQDGGVPQAGCYCANCAPARTDPTRRKLVVCLGLVGGARNRRGSLWRAMAAGERGVMTSCLKLQIQVQYMVPDLA